MRKTVKELAQLIQGEVAGDGGIVISGITNIETPAAGTITFVQDAKPMKALEESAVACVIAPSSVRSAKKTLIHVKEPKLAWAKLIRLFYPEKIYSKTISPLASVAKSARVGSGVTIEPFAVISEKTVIGDDAVIRAHAFVGENVQIGNGTLLQPHVVVYEDCVIGSNVIIHAGSVIGSDGFGYVHTPERQEKIPQVGNVIIEDSVELGASVTIDRATIGSTVIGKGCKIDNLVQIGHNVILGPHTVISAQTGISGSCKIGSHVTMGGKVGLGDHVEIGDWTMVGAGAGFPTGKKVPPRQIFFGEPARPYHEAKKQIAAQLRSAEMYEEIKKLRRQLAELEKKVGKSAVPG